MKTDNQPEASSKSVEINRRIDLDLLSRSIPGVIIYAILWPVMFFPVGFHRLEPEYSWGFAGALAGFSLLRAIQVKLTASWHQQNPKTWLYYFAAMSLAQAALWGALFVLALTDPRFEAVSFMMVLAIGGMASGANSALNPRLWLAISNVVLILGPGIFATLFIANDFSLFALISIYLVYLIMLSRRSYAEYRRAFKIEIELEAQRKELERLNQIDPLTAIYNRGHFNSNFEFQWGNGMRAHQPQALLLIDADYFKQINDQYGHLFGDECLKSIASCIHQIAKRKTDLIARFGGEEFAVLLSNTSCDEAAVLAETIRQKVAEEPFEHEGKKIQITVSVGAACLVPEPEMNSNQLIEYADKALYQAKDAGRNCVRQYQSTT